MKKIILLIITIVVFSNCSDSFLDISNPGRLSPSLFPTSMEDMEQVVTSMYGNMTQPLVFGKRIFAKGTFITDHTVDMSWVGDSEWNQLATNQITSDNTYTSTLWYGLYKIVSCANTVMENLERLDTSRFTDEDIQRMSQMRGEALFWRGWCHQLLVCLYGEGYPANGDGDKQGIPLRLEVASTPASLNIPRSTVQEVYDQILKDYEEALKLLPAGWSNESDYPRPTQYAVKSYIGQVNLFMGNKDAAKTVLKDVIDNSGKVLVDFADYEQMFNQNQKKFNNESILELNLRNGNSGADMWNSEGSQYALLAALCFRNSAGNVESAGWGNIFLHDSNIDRFGSDPRLHIVSLEPGTPVVMRGTNTVVVKYKDIEDEYKGWSMRKYIPLDGVVGESPYLSSSVGINFFLMRLADVYLMYAEACLGSDDATAREYINKVRRRAYDLPINATSSIDIQSSGDQLVNDYREERFKEFCGEGVQHWLDVCRWKTLQQEITTWYPKTRVGAPNYDDKDLYYPIPRVELENNPAMTQSKGYENS